MRICKIFGISIELHSTFVWLALIIVLLLGFTMPSQLLPVISLLLMLFMTVLVHELFHSVVAISKGIRIDKIVLLPIGGISMAESIPEKPRDEMEIAFAGPLFNFAMVIIIIGMIKFIPGLPWPTKLISTGITLEKLNFAIMNYPLFALFWVNFILGAFNLFLPALPLDGGRVFRAMMATRFSFVKATKIAALVSSFLAIALFIFGFFIGDLIIIIIAAFIYFGAAQERDMAILKEVARGIDLRDAINKRPMIIEGKMRVEEAAEIMKEKKKTALLVSLKKGYGVIGIDDVAKAMEENKKMKVSEACQKTRLIPIEKKGEIITAIFAKKLPIVAISEDNELIGTISENQINKMYALSKLSSRKGIN